LDIDAGFWWPRRRHLRAEDTLVVWRLDRPLRSLIETITAQQRDVAIRSLTEGVDTTTAAGRTTFHIFGALAEFERSLIQERTSRAHSFYNSSGARPSATAYHRHPRFVLHLRSISSS